MLFRSNRTATAHATTKDNACYLPSGIPSATTCVTIWPSSRLGRCWRRHVVNRRGPTTRARRKSAHGADADSASRHRRQERRQDNADAESASRQRCDERRKIVRQVARDRPALPRARMIKGQFARMQHRATCSHTSTHAAVLGITDHRVPD